MKCAYLYTYVVHPRWYVDMLNEQFLMFFFFYISPWMDENYTTVLYIYICLIYDFMIWLPDMYIYIYIIYISLLPLWLYFRSLPGLWTLGQCADHHQRGEAGFNWAAVFAVWNGGFTGWKAPFYYPIGSMVLVYMLTWMGYIDGKCYHI
jgi:hypothetical protein